MPKRHLLRLSLTLFLSLAWPLSGCATITGTLVSPITGGVDLAREYTHGDNWYMAPIYFLGGVVAGPFVAFYNGVTYDAAVFQNFLGYWTEFDGIFRPFHMINHQ